MSGYVTPDHYLEMERAAEFRSEYADGVVYSMAGGSIDHARISLNIAAAARLALRGGSCEAFGSDLKVWIPAAKRFFYPDVSFICGKLRFRDGHQDTIENPVAIVEVQSPSTAEYDRTEKFRHYRMIPELKQFVVVSQSKPHVEVFTFMDGFWVYKEYSSMDETVQLESIPFPLPMPAIYEGVDFTAERDSA